MLDIVASQAASSLALRSSDAPVLRSLSTAVPDYSYTQDFVTAQAREVFGRTRDDFDRLEPIFENTGIRRRYAVRPLDWFLSPQDWVTRSRAYLEAGVSLYRNVAAAAIAEAGLSAAKIDTLVTVSSTGIATPSLEARVLGDIGLRPDVRRVPVFGLGCAGGVTGLALAARLAAAAPGETVLMVALELCSLSFRLDEASAKSIVATALFGDGAAAAVVSTGGGQGLASLHQAGEYTWPDTLDIMGWQVDPLGFGVILSRSIPDFVAQEMRPATEAFLARHGLTLGDLDHFTFHPGGARVVDALAAAFGLPSSALDGSRGVLRDFGNMSSPTVLFVLARALAAGEKGRGLMAALGPGFTASYLRYDC